MAKPDYTIWVAGVNATGRAGAAWINDDGSISIVLDTWVILRGKGHAGAPTTIKLYPPDSERKKPERKEPKPKSPDYPEDDDIPF